MGSSITANNLTKTYGKGDAAVHALKGLSVSIEGGKFIAVIGSSGSGKSTLLKLMGALQMQTQVRCCLMGSTYCS